jgi:hypothetical protein
MNIVSTELGADCVIVRVAGHDGDSFETWYAALTEAVGALLDSGVFDGALPTTGDFVTKGVPCLFQGEGLRNLVRRSRGNSHQVRHLATPSGARTY